MKHFLQKAFLFLLGGVLCSLSTSAQDYVYTNDLSEAHDATVVGGGSFVADEVFGTVYQNVMDAENLRSNYLLLPDDVLSHAAESKQMTIAFWVSAEGFTPDQYTYVPFFTAYGQSPAANAEAGNAGNENNWPIFYALSRGPIALNNGGWCNFGSDLNVASKNTLYNTNSFDLGDYTNGGNWLEDQKWHYYTLVLTETNVKCYMDGVIKNEWNVDGTSDGQVVSGFFTYGENYKYICLGGNQPWNWGDPDSPFKYAKLRIQNNAMTAEDIAAQMEKDKTTTIIGNEDNTTVWWSAFSDYYTIEPNKTLKLEFKNYSDKEANFHNWLAVITTDADRGAEGYSEYVALRADNWAWQYSLNTGAESTHDWFTSLTSNYSWDYDGQTNGAKFRDEMDGSDVVMTITRLNETVTIHADITAQSGEKYYEEFVINCGDGTQNIRAFLSIEGGHLILDNDATTITDTEMPPVVPEGLIGNEDNSTTWWTAFSDYFTIEPNKTLTLKFQNYSNKEQDYYNWLTFVTTDANRGAEGYSEYVALQATGYGWQGELNTNNNESNWFKTNQNNYDWKTFKDDMDGATVVLTIKRIDADVLITSDVTTKENKKFRHYFVLPCGDGTQNIRAFLSTEKGHLILDKEATTIENTERLSYNKLIGLENNTALFNTMFSDDFILKKNESVDLEFINYTCGVQNWHNWVLFVTNDEDRGSTDYTEHVVLRADAAGLAGFDATKLTSENYPENWTTFREDMNSANVKMNIKREGAKVTITATSTGVSRNEYKETYVDEYGDGEQNIRVFLSTECGHLDLLSAKISEDPASGISTIDAQNATQDAPMFDLSGRRVDASYKGIVIQNGKKMIVK